MPRLRVLGGDTPRLKLEFEGGFAPFRPFEVDVVGWSWYGGGMILFVLLLPPGLKRELLLLCVDLDSIFAFEE